MVESCRFKLLVSYDVQQAENGFKQVEIAYLAVISHLDKLVQPGYTLALFPGPRPTSHRLQYGKAGEGLVHFLT